MCTAIRDVQDKVERGNGAEEKLSSGQGIEVIANIVEWVRRRKDELTEVFFRNSAQ